MREQPRKSHGTTKLLGRRLLRIMLLLSALSLFDLAYGQAASYPPGPYDKADRDLVDDPASSLNDRFGIAHISYGSRPSDPKRYQRATTTGVRWNRWAAYWHDIEPAPGVFDYRQIDTTIQADRKHGLELDVVLMGTPSYYATTTQDQVKNAGPGETVAVSAPRNLALPVFADGTDVLRAGKAINPDNYWARFVATTAARYKDQVRHWEIWNEPDYRTFWWTGDGQEVKHYVRLLKVAYLAIKAVDPLAQVVTGGLMHWEWATRSQSEHAWLQAFLEELVSDPGRDRHGYYFDVLALHWYARPADIYSKTIAARRLLEEHGIGRKRIWINEANLAVCSDPGTGGKPDCTAGVSKGRLEEQASFVLQATANALAATVDKVFIFQLYDDALGPFEYYGLIRNDDSPRPAYRALQVATRYFRDITAATRVSVPPVEAVTLNTRDGVTVVVLWNGGPTAVQVAIPARAAGALQVTQTGEERTLPAQAGAYHVNLPGATFNLAAASLASDFPVGGQTSLIVEKVSR